MDQKGFCSKFGITFKTLFSIYRKNLWLLNFLCKNFPKKYPRKVFTTPPQKMTIKASQKFNAPKSTNIPDEIDTISPSKIVNRKMNR